MIEADAVFKVLVYALGFVGIASIGLIPIRSWGLLRSVFKMRALSLPKIFLVLRILIYVLLGIVVYADVQITLRVFRCLTSDYCGPGVASGWIYLALLGSLYFLFEVAILVLKRIPSRVLGRDGISE